MSRSASSPSILITFVTGDADVKADEDSEVSPPQPLKAKDAQARIVCIFMNSPTFTDD
jgi:hypothetical protein